MNILRSRDAGLAAGILAAALVAWIVTYDRMRGMDAGPGTDLGALGWYLGIWVTMMAAMMLPSAAPMVLLFARVRREQASRGKAGTSSIAFFLGGYLAAWTAYGLAAYGVFRALRVVAPGFIDWDRGGPYVAGAAIAAAGLYELTPLKTVCLRHCRGPMHFLLHGWRRGPAGATRMGIEHGAYCVGCCWGLMVVLFALGVMSLTWMAAVATVILAQKVLPGGERTTRATAVVFLAAGIWVAVAPDSIPGLTRPGSAPPSLQMG